MQNTLKKRVVLILVLAIFSILVAFGTAIADPFVAFDVVSAGSVYSDYPYRVGNYFVVGNRPIAVLSLGVYDDPFTPGISNPIHAGLFDNVGGGTLLDGADVWIEPGVLSHSRENIEFVYLKMPVILPPHFVGSIAAAGFNPQDPMAATAGGAFIQTDGAGGAVSFPSPITGWVTYDSDLGATRGAYTDEPILYGVSFEYRPVPEPGSIILLAVGLGAVLLVSHRIKINRPSRA